MLLLRAIVTGFGLSLGAAVFKKHVQSRLGLDDDIDKNKPDKDKKEKDEMLARDGATDPNLQRS